MILNYVLRPNAKVRADVCLKSLSRAHYFPRYSSINYSTPIVWKISEDFALTFTFAFQI